MSVPAMTDQPAARPFSAESWKVRLPTPERAHTMEIFIGYEITNSNWTIRCLESKSGAGRGASPTWYGFKPQDYRILREFALAPRMAELIRLAAASRQVGLFFEECERLVAELDVDAVSGL